jgi:hypothetical protein
MTTASWIDNVSAVLTTSGSVSSLARDARNLISGKEDASNAPEVLRRIDQMAAEWRSLPDAPIATWLTNLRREVEAAC